jgi:uncharacterized protein (TIGR02300 family)
MAILISLATKETKVVKPEWGVKRTCNSCGAKFYDLRRDPIICPKCDATVDPVAVARSQRAKVPLAVVKEAPVPPVAKADEVDDENNVVADDVLDIVEEDEEDDDAAAIEDVSELGEDHDDMLGVIDKVSDEGEETR